MLFRSELYPEPDAPKGGDKPAAPKQEAPKVEDKKAVTSNKDQGTKAAPLAMPTNKTQMQAGKYYSTSKGVAKWDGSKFVTE